MKRIACILLTLSTFAAQFSNAQNCPGSATYTNQSGTFDLTAGRTIVLNNGGTFQITIQNDFSSTSSICILNGSTLNLSFQNVNNMGKGGFINVDKNAKLNLTGSGINNFPLTISNGGTTTQSVNITYSDGATINNTGTYTISTDATLNSGTVTFSNTSTLNIAANLNYNNGSFSLSNSAAGTIAFNNNLTLSNTTITNSGTINYSGSVTLQGSSAITNNGYMYMKGNNSPGLAFSGASFTNNGVLSVNNSITINSGSTLTNSCTIKGYGDFNNNGTVSNTGSVLLSVNASSNFINQGTFTNGTKAAVQGTNFTNNNNVSGGGNFYFSGNTTNQGPFNGTSSSIKINFYDASNTTSKYFDNQNTTPANTTKNVTTPNSSTSFTSCSDVTAPVITAQPSTQIFCSPTTTSATFSITATSNNTPAYQWYKNGAAISGATSSSFTATGLTLTDTATAFTVGVSNAAGTTTSSSASVKYIIIAQPSPLTQYLATGNATSFAIKTSGATAWQWQKNSSSISGTTSVSYALAVVNYADSGNYTVLVSYNGGTCTSNAAVLRTSVVLYSKSAGNLNLPATWGVAADGSGSSPVDFTRTEHTFVVANRTSAATGSDLSIAGTLNVASSNVTITPNTTLNAGRIIRVVNDNTVTPGVLSVSSTANLTVNGIAIPAYAGASDLYFDPKNDTIKNLIIANHTVTLHTALNITAGSKPGIVQVNSGTLATSDSLTLKSDSLGTASIAPSAGTINGKVTIEKFVHARRAWRLMSAPVTAVNAPSIHAAWQEGAVSSTDNPHPGYGTHITYGATSNGFDQNPQKSFSMKVYTNGNLVGVPPTNTTLVTDYPAYFLFVRGSRAYDITNTTNNTTPTTTILRVTGNVNQGTLAAKTVTATGVTLVSNPYACPVNFTNILTTSSNIKNRLHVWDPTLAGSSGVGAWVVVDGSTGTFRATPPSTYASTLLQAGEGFFIESNDGVNNGSIVIGENAKDLSGTTVSNDRVGDASADTSLEINLKVINPDGSAAIADGVLYNFNAANNDSVDNNDAVKFYNFNNNLGITDANKVLSIDNRTVPAAGDSLKLNFTGSQSANYQIEVVPSSLGNQTLSLYDKYLNSYSPINATDTTRITFSINTSIADSKAADRFTIVVVKSKIKSSVLPVTFTNVKAYAENKAINVDWNVANESDIAYYEVQTSANANSFSTAGRVAATGASTYSFTDATPATGINYYRIKSVGKGGDIQYSSVVSAQLPSADVTGTPAISVYPNPLTGAAFTLTLTNMAAGTYSLSVVNQNGVSVFSKSIAHNGGTASQKVTLTNTLAAGVYYLKIASATGTTSFVKVQAN